MRSRLAMSMAAAVVVAAPVITIASASASVSAHPVRGQAIKAAPAVSKPDKPHGNKHCGYPTNRPNVYLGPSSQTVSRGQRAAAVGWAGCNGKALTGAAVDLRVSGQADGVCSAVGGQGAFRCSTTHLEHSVTAHAAVRNSVSNGIKIKVTR